MLLFLINLLVLIRPYQWVKNCFVLIGIFFGHAWCDSQLLKAALLAFASFCLASSSVYIFNDIKDIEADRLHPKKKERPIAAGKLKRETAIHIMAVLAIGAIGLSMLASRMTIIIILAYILVNVAYSIKMKQVVILDVFSIAIGFMLRILAGTHGIGIQPSRWLLLCGMMLTLFLGFSKRRAEFISHPIFSLSHPQALLHYSPVLLDKMISISAACIILSYSLYTMSAETINIHGTANLIYTVPFVIYGIFRYIYLLYHKNLGSDASYDIFCDPGLLISGICWIIITLLLIM